VLKQINQFIAPRIPDSAKQAWLNLAAKEQKLVILMAWVLAFAVLYFFIWQPAENGLANSERKLQQAKTEWQWLNDQAATLATQSAGTKQVRFTTQSRLTAYVQQQLRRHNIFAAMSQIVPVNKRSSVGIQLVFNEVNAPDYFRWLSKMEAEGLPAKSMTVTPIKTGLVSATVSFEVSQ